MKYNIDYKRSIEIYPHCIVCGKKACTYLQEFTFLCKKCDKLWSIFFNKNHRRDSDLRSFKKIWRKRFIEFIKKNCKQKKK